MRLRLLQGELRPTELRGIFLPVLGAMHRHHLEHQSSIMTKDTATRLAWQREYALRRKKAIRLAKRRKPLGPPTGKEAEWREFREQLIGKPIDLYE